MINLGLNFPAHSDSHHETVKNYNEKRRIEKKKRGKNRSAIQILKNYYEIFDNSKLGHLSGGEEVGEEVGVGRYELLPTLVGRMVGDTVWALLDVNIVN